MTHIIPRRALIAALIAGPLAVGSLTGCASQGMTTEDTTALVDSEAVKKARTSSSAMVRTMMYRLTCRIRR